MPDRPAWFHGRRPWWARRSSRAWPSAWALMNADPQMRDDLRALRRGGTAVCLVLLALLVLVVVASR